MKNAIINVKTDRVLKRRVEEFAAHTGMSLSDVVNLALRQVVNDRRLVVEEPLVPNEKTGKLLRRALKDFKAGRNISGPFTTAQQIDKYLKSA